MCMKALENPTENLKNKNLQINSVSLYFHQSRFLWKKKYIFYFFTHKNYQILYIRGFAKRANGLLRVVLL